MKLHINELPLHNLDPHLDRYISGQDMYLEPIVKPLKTCEILSLVKFIAIKGNGIPAVDF